MSMKMDETSDKPTRPEPDRSGPVPEPLQVDPMSDEELARFEQLVEAAQGDFKKAADQMLAMGAGKSDSTVVEEDGGGNDHEDGDDGSGA